MCTTKNEKRICHFPPARVRHAVHLYIIILSSNARPMHQFLLTLGAVNNISKNKTLSSYIYIIHINIHAHILRATYMRIYYTRACTFLSRGVYPTYIHIMLHRIAAAAVYGPYPREIETHYK